MIKAVFWTEAQSLVLLRLELLKRSHISLVSRAQAQTLAPGGFARFWSSCPKERATAPPVSDRVGRQSRRHQF